MNLIPVTILTGFLGSGKTTLLKRILNENHGFKIAVIENEFGEENIDNDILLRNGDEQIIQMSNGCICCSIRGDLVNGLNELINKKRSGKINFDRVVIETTGVANPGPVAQTFFMDDSVAEAYRLDAVVTLVDAKHGHTQLNEHEEAQRQVGFADRLFITKSDLEAAENIAALRHRLMHMNPRAPIATAHFGDIPIEAFFDLKGFNLNAVLDIDPHFLHAHDEHPHSHKEGESCSHCDHTHHHPQHSHADRIRSFVFRAERPFDYALLEDFLSGLLTVYGEKLLRYKGVLWMKGVDHKVILQGVHELMGSDVASAWGNEPRQSRMVFIGIDLPHDLLQKGLENCLVSP